MRLDRFVSEHLACTRKVATLRIKSGEISVDGLTVITPSVHVMPSQQLIAHNGNRLKQNAPLYLMMHKPIGFVCSDEDSTHPLIKDLIAQETQTKTRSALQVVGRLDVDTSGLLLLTTDGKWNQALRSPSKKVPKRYLVSLEKPLSESHKAQLEKGILLRSEDKPTAACKIEIHQNTQHQKQQLSMTLTEGKYHQVKRMFAAVGNHVLSLHRDRIGPWELDESLAPGEYRSLTEEELQRL